MIRYVLPFTITLAIAAPAFAAEYYIVRGPDKKCQVVEARPTDTKMVIMGNKAYVSREEATKQLTLVCKE